MICTVILAETISEVRSQVEEAKNQGSLIIELRLDGLKEIDINEIEKVVQQYDDGNLILTLRSEWNSKSLIPLNGRKEVLKQIIDLEPSYIDLEYPIDMGLINQLSEKTTPIITTLDFEGMAKIAIDPVLKVNKKFGRDCVIKIACTPNNVENLQQIWRWAKILRKKKLNYVIVGMGQLGQISRIKSRELGNLWTYGRFDEEEGEPYLPGMLSIKDLKLANADEAWHLASLGSLPQTDALRTIYSNLFKTSSLPGIFLNIPINTSPELDQMLLWVEDGLLDGINVTSPWQVEIMSKIPLKDRSAIIMGAANCLTITKDGLKAYNTQIDGLRRSLEPFSLKRINRVFIEGTERIARATVEVLHSHVEQIVVRDEMFSEGNPLFDDYENLLPSGDSYSNDFDLVVNCNTPAKGFEKVVMLPKKIVDNAKIIFDPMSKISTPTPLMKLAERQNKKYIGGYQFFFNTALSSFELWTKRSIPPSSLNSQMFDIYKDKIDFGFMLNY